MSVLIVQEDWPYAYAAVVQTLQFQVRMCLIVWFE